MGLLIGLSLMELGVASVLGIATASMLLVPTLLGAVIGVFNAGRWLIVIAVAFGALLLTVATTPAIEKSVDRWVRQDTIPARPADALIALTSGVLADSALDGAGTSRLLTALELFQAGVAPLLLTGTVRQAFADGVLSSANDQKRLAHMAHADTGFLILPLVHSTRDEAILSSRILSPRGKRRVVVVTSPLHTRRACMVFERVGFVVTCVPAREHDRSRWHPATVADRLAAFRDYLYERCATLEYRRRGWL